MTQRQLNTQALLAEAFDGLGHVLGVNINTHTILPTILSRRWTVFQVPSSTNPRLLHYIVGSKRDGFRCSCLGWQAYRHCYHATAVERALLEIARERKMRNKNQRRKKATK